MRHNVMLDADCARTQYGDVNATWRDGVVMTTPSAPCRQPGPTAPSLQFSLAATIAICVCCAIMIAITTLGNIMVIMAFFIDKRIRRFSNFLILNLAITDLVVGIINVPSYVPLLLTGSWPLGRPYCIIWLVCDYVTPAASSWSILMISLDRYWSVYDPLNYKYKQNSCRVVTCMSIPWIMGLFVYGPAIVFWEYWAGETPTPGTCIVGFHQNLGYLMFGAVCEFIIPFITVSLVNFLIYLNIRRRSRERIAQASKVCTGYNGSAHDRAKRLAKDKKTAKAVGIIITVYGITWAPYQVISLIQSLCGSCVNEVVSEIAFWLLWFNSSVNPILYTFTHAQFRQAFQKILNMFVCHSEPVLRVYPLSSNASGLISRNHVN